MYKRQVLLEAGLFALLGASGVSLPPQPVSRTAASTTLAESTRAAGITKTALIVVGDFLSAQYDRSKLYDPAFTTEFRRGTDR